MHNTVVTTDQIWHRQVPLKVTILAWRLLRNRLLIKDNLVACGIIPSETQSCISRCGGIETTQHLFLHYSCFGSLWGAVLAWFGTSTVVSCIVQDHFFRFVYVSGGTCRRRNFMQLV